MSEDTAKIEESESYEETKASYAVMDSYEIPAWYRNHVWLWSIVIMYIFIVACVTPEARTFAAVSWGLAIVALDVMAILVRRNWPL